MSRLLLDPTWLEIWDSLELKALDVSWRYIVGKYNSATDWPIGPIDPNSPLVKICSPDHICPAQPVITDILDLPWWPECCANGLIWWDNNCWLRTICPADFPWFFNWEDRLVTADPTDQTPGTLVEKIISCNPSVLSISLDSNWPNHKLVLCINESNLNLRITDLIDWPGNYPLCSSNSTGILYSNWAWRDWLCPWSNTNKSCITNQNVLSKRTYLWYDFKNESLEFRHTKLMYHASVWHNSSSNTIYTWAPDLALTSIPCNARWSMAGWDHYISCMYEQWTTWVWWHPTWDIVIPETGYWMVNFHVACMCNLYTHAFRMWVAVVESGVHENNRQVLCDVKKWQFRDNYAPEEDGDSSFIWPEMFECNTLAKNNMYFLKENQLTWGRTDEFWLTQWTKLRMFVKADANDRYYDEGSWCSYPPAKVKVLWHNPFSMNHPKATVAGFSVWKIPVEILP